jgi:hypothetical protein
MNDDVLVADAVRHHKTGVVAGSFPEVATRFTSTLMSVQPSDLAD